MATKPKLYVMTDEAKAAKRECDQIDAEVARLTKVINGLKDRKREALVRLADGTLIDCDAL